MLEPDASIRAAPAHGNPPTSFGPDALQILASEHWSLLAARSLVYAEAMSRASIFIAALGASVVALALVAQATDFGSGFHAFALVLLPVDYFLGLVTVMRLAQISREDGLWVQGMNRIRNAYLQIAPELEPYFVTSRYDDVAGILHSALATRNRLPRLQPFAAVPGVISVIDSVVAGAVVGIAGLALDVDTGWSLALGGVGFLVSIGSFVSFARRVIRRDLEAVESLFPSPAPDDSE